MLSVDAIATSGKNKSDKYTFAVFPYISAKQLGNSYGPVAAEFSKILGTQVNFTSTPNYEDFTVGLAEGRFDIAVVQPFDYARAVDNYGYRPLARVDADLRAHFVVKTDSKYQSLADLKGSRVALPSTTIDWNVVDGVRDIPIEQRDEQEVSQIQGNNERGELTSITVTPAGSPVANPAFDVTPARLITGLITERGIAPASYEGLTKLFPMGTKP